MFVVPLPGLLLHVLLRSVPLAAAMVEVNDRRAAQAVLIAYMFAHLDAELHVGGLEMVFLEVGIFLEILRAEALAEAHGNALRFAMAEIALANRPPDRLALLALDFGGGRTVEQAITDLTGKIGEKIDVRRVSVIEATNGSQVVGYVHPGSKLGVLVELSGSGDLQTAGRDVAMQAAAMNPIATTRDDVPVEVQEKEMEIGREAARNAGKPEHILDKIATGKLERYFKDNVLVEQPFVKDSSMSVKQMLQNADAELKRFVRFALGD